MAVLVPSVLAMAAGDSDDSPSVFLPRLVNGASRLAVSKPSWVVRTASNVRREKMKKPDPPCVVCAGSGRIDCHNCQGRGLSYVSKYQSGEQIAWNWPCFPRVNGQDGARFAVGVDLTTVTDVSEPESTVI
ncbi:uncharacterized protein LOC122024385 isoform X2 [Zingiber officinale]|uniref:uncharacterized protein LOC122024385 isoform X2 n=1 Tax=Zingiber officinale TaxID=94328 RepID=UPI001C4D1419|nr:uncharacterized protein LOC122024385 isoform X2 [Zingiber officinale]